MSGAFREINSAQIYSITEGSGVPVVLLHGFGLDQRMWDDQAAVLAERFYVIRYDMRGYGRSSLPTAEPYAHAEDLFALLSSLNAQPAHVVGLSNGGRHALRFALAHPQALRSLTLVGSALDGHVWSRQWQAMWKRVESTAKAGDLTGAKRLWLEHPLFGPAQDQAGVAARLRQMVQEYSGWHWVHTDPGVASNPPAIDRLDAIQAPTLVVVGDRDLPDIHSIAEVLKSGISDAELVAMPSVGHMANMEAPAEFNSLLLNFLAR